MSGGMFNVGCKSPARARRETKVIERLLQPVVRDRLVQIGNPAALIVVQRAAAPPPAADYDLWLAHRAVDPRGKMKMTGAKLRRAVIMLRQGSTMQDAARAIGFRNSDSLKRWVAILPEGLAV